MAFDLNDYLLPLLEGELLVVEKVVAERDVEGIVGFFTAYYLSFPDRGNGNICHGGFNTNYRFSHYL